MRYINLRFTYLLTVYFYENHHDTVWPTSYKSSPRLAASWQMCHEAANHGLVIWDANTKRESSVISVCSWQTQVCLHSSVIRDGTKSGILKFPIGMAEKRQKSGRIPPKAGTMAAMQQQLVCSFNVDA